MGAKNDGYRPAHQNKVKFSHNPHSQLTKQIMAIEHDCLCDRCVAIIDWRKNFRKYKPIKEPRRCNVCLNKAIDRAYHTICETCAREKGVCAKCTLPCDASTRPKKVTDEEVMNLLNNSGIKERLKRSMLRNWENGLLSSHDVVTVVTADANGTSIDWTKLLAVEDAGEIDESDDDAKDMGVVSSAPKKKILRPRAPKAVAPSTTDVSLLETAVAGLSVQETAVSATAEKPKIKAAVKVTKSVKVIKQPKINNTKVVGNRPAGESEDQPKVLRGVSAGAHSGSAVAVSQLQTEFKIKK